MSQLFEKKDPRRKWKGYRIHFYPHEHISPQNKPLDLIHIHFKGQTGEIELYLKDYHLIHQWGKVSEPEQNEIKNFVQENHSDIVNKIKKKLAKVKIKLDISWQDWE